MIKFEVSIKVAGNGLVLGEVGELNSQMFSNPLMLIDVQMHNLALLPPFCEALVPVAQLVKDVHMLKIQTKVD